jgi:hypothetical protein
MTREQYVFYPALSASRIKRHYTGDISHHSKALDAGADFHRRLLEVTPDYMDSEAKCVYKSIVANTPWQQLWNDSLKEYPAVSNLSIAGQVIPAKAMLDLYPKSYGIGCDIKTTSCTNMADFARDMVHHYNHIQAVWFSKVLGIDPRGFVFIGVPHSARRGLVKPGNIFFYSFDDTLIHQAELLIEQYIRSEWKEVQKYLNTRPQGVAR